MTISVYQITSKVQQDPLPTMGNPNVRVPDVASFISIPIHRRHIISIAEKEENLLKEIQLKIQKQY